MQTAAEQGRRWVVERFGGTGELKLTAFDLPEPQAGELLVRILSTDATYTDQLIIRGNYRPLPPLPVTPGYCCIGVVEAAGPGCRIQPGARIAALPQSGCLATHRLLPDSLAVACREDVAPEKAISAVLTGVTAYQMLHRISGGRLKAEASIFVHACTGGTGAMLVSLAKIAGVSTIFGTCSARNLQAASAHGVQALDYGSDWEAAVRQAHPDGFDLVFDSVVLQGYQGKCLRLLKKGGKYIAYGLTNKAAPGTFSLGSVILSLVVKMSLQEALWSCCDGKRAEFYNIGDRFKAKPEEYKADLTVLLDLMAQGKLEPLVGRVWSSLDEGKEALQAIEAGTHTGKQVVLISQP